MTYTAARHQGAIDMFWDVRGQTRETKVAVLFFSVTKVELRTLDQRRTIGVKP